MNPWLKVVLMVTGLIAVHYVLINLYIFFTVIYYGVFVGLTGEEIDDAALQTFLNTQISYAIIFAGVIAFVIYGLIYYVRGFNLFKISRFRRVAPSKAIVACLIGFSTVFLSSIVVYIVAQIFPDAFDRFLESVDQLETSGFIPLFIAVVLVAPFIEEILFRGLIFDVLERRTSLVVTVIAQGVLFGAYHMNIIQGSYAMILGIILGLSLIWTGSIWVPILIHLANNLMATVLGIDAVYDWTVANEFTFGLIANALLVVVLPSGLFYLYKTRTPFNKRIDGSQPAVASFTEEKTASIDPDEDPFAQYDQ